MEYITIKDELIDSKYWMVRYYAKYELTNPTSAHGSNGLNGFTLKTKTFADLKLITRTSKPIAFGDKKTDTIETNLITLALDDNSESFITSDFLKEQDEVLVEKAHVYMGRIIGALNTIEQSVMASSNTMQGEGTDTSAISLQEKEGRKRLEKAAKRLDRLFSNITNIELSDYTALYLENDVHPAIESYVSDYS